MIRVVIAEDSALARKLLTNILESDPSIKVVGAAMNGIFALRRVYRDKPDVVTMDFDMPQMDGLETLKTLMDRHPVPVVMLSAHTAKGTELTMKALELGAVDFVEKPMGRESETLHKLQAELIAKVKAAAAIKYKQPKFASEEEVTLGNIKPSKEKKNSTRRYITGANLKIKQANNKRLESLPPQTKTFNPNSNSPIRLLVIGSSTGGVPGVTSILTSLPSDAPPTLVVQHMPATFTGSFSKRLNGKCKVNVVEAKDGMKLERGLVLVARGGTQLGIRCLKDYCVASVTDDPKVSGHKPSADYLFKSAAKVVGEKCLGVILTGMGKDGAEGLLEMKNTNSWTIAESEATCVIYGMPKAAIDLGAAQFVLASHDIPRKILDLINGKNK